jgi:hypothetical protein
MNRHFRLRFALLVGGALVATAAVAQVSPTTPRAAHVRIISGPELERLDPDFAIVRWTSNNPGGAPEHEGVVRYGTDPQHLTRTARSPIRLNPSHPDTIFRVRVEGLEPRTTYYYTVDASDPSGHSDGVKSAVQHFTTPAT